MTSEEAEKIENKTKSDGGDDDIVQPKGGNILYAGWLRLALMTPSAHAKFPPIADHNNATTPLEFMNSTYEDATLE